MKLNLAPLINLSIRALTLLGKFVLLFYMAKFLSLEEVGVYGLLVVLVSYSLYAVGFDFYTYSTREIIQMQKDEWGGVLKKQGQLILCTYIIVLPLIAYISSYFVAPKWIIFLSVLIVLEHLNQEMMRLLIVDHKPVLANNLLFIRSGLWCYIVILFMILGWFDTSLETILWFWIIFDVSALLIGCLYFSQNSFFKSKKIITNDWLISGLKICIPLLLSTLIIRAITTIDRMILEKFDGLEVVAVYALFMGLTNSLISFLETGVFSFIYPKMILQKNNPSEFRALLKKMVFHTVLLMIVITLGLLVLLPFLLKWVGKEVYFTHYNIFYLVLVANIIYCLSMIPHYILYTKNKDKKIIFSHIFGMIVFLGSALLFVYNGVSVSVAYSLIFSFLTIFLLKLFLSLKEIR